MNIRLKCVKEPSKGSPGEDSPWNVRREYKKAQKNARSLSLLFFLVEDSGHIPSLESEPPPPWDLISLTPLVFKGDFNTCTNDDLWSLQSDYLRSRAHKQEPEIFI